MTAADAASPHPGSPADLLPPDAPADDAALRGPRPPLLRFLLAICTRRRSCHDQRRVLQPLESPA